MSDQNSEFLIKIKTALEDAGIKATAEQLNAVANAAKNANAAMGEVGASAGKGLEGIGESAKKASEGTGELLEGHHGIHAIGHALNEAMPGLMQFTRFLTSGFTAAIGAAVL